jgi:hypothetical protein
MNEGDVLSIFGVPALLLGLGLAALVWTRRGAKCIDAVKSRPKTTAPHGRPSSAVFTSTTLSQEASAKASRALERLKQNLAQP